MTLMEVVIAIGVVAFVIPIFLVMSKEAGDSRMNAEADTRSAWLAREVKQEILAAWATPPRESHFGGPLTFPTLATEATAEVLVYDYEGKFLAKGSAADLNGRSNIPNASYVVAVHGEAYQPPNAVAPSQNLSLIQIRVLHPAKAPPNNRRAYRYPFISTRQGTL
jgi:hypothetical protein